MEQLLQEFIRLYGPNDQTIHRFFSPGRVNLIGEHTDYNGGYVFPCALSFGTYLLVRFNNNNLLRFATTNFNFTIEIPVNQEIIKISDKWVNYPLGVIKELQTKGLNLSGMDMLFSGNIPNSAGLSSSASIELVTAVAMNAIYNLGISQIDLVIAGRAAENKFVGVNCGIMDQFAVGMGKKGHAMYLKCDTLDYELVPVKMEGYKLLIANTNKSRGLADSKYNERVAECQTAVHELSQGTPVKFLAELNNYQFDQYSHLISNETVYRRARHVVSENQRVLEAVKSLKDGDLIRFGQLMNESHDSLRDDYEVTGLELDTLVNEMRKIPGVLGARMTGAGFGGCTVSLVKEEIIDELIEKVGPAYQKITGLKADFYIAEIGDGASAV